MSDGAAAAANTEATIQYSFYNQKGAYAGKTVKAVKDQLGPVMQLPQGAKAFKGKTELDDNYVIQPGDVISLQKRMGEKGRKGCPSSSFFG